LDNSTWWDAYVLDRAIDLQFFNSKITRLIRISLSTPKLGGGLESINH